VPTSSTKGVDTLFDALAGMIVERATGKMSPKPGFERADSKSEKKKKFGLF
jgi:hypothetical protein